MSLYVECPDCHRTECELLGDVVLGCEYCLEKKINGERE